LGWVGDRSSKAMASQNCERLPGNATSVMKHVLFINEFFHPDICASAAVAADHLPVIVGLRPDWKVTIIAGDRAWDDPSIIYPAEGEYRGVHIVRVRRPAVSRVNLLRRALGFAAFGRGAVNGAGRMDRVDLVVATTAPPQGADIARKIARRHGCPYIYKVLDLYPDLAATLGRVKAGGFIYRRWLARDTRAMRDAAMVVSIGERMTERIGRTREISLSKLRTVHDGFDPARIDAGGHDDFGRQYNPGCRFVVQYAGNMGLSHPFDTILSAARRLAEDPAVLFQFIGDGPQRRFVQENLPPNAQVIDYQPAERLGEVLSSADLCLISQHDEMFDKALPYKIYAILAAGKPCIFVGNRRSEIAQWLAESGAGVQIDQGATENLARTIGELKSQPDRAKQMGRAARELFDRRFHVTQAAEKWVELIEEAAASNCRVEAC
jgi:colanic acid biosynthesis glycosyl transferase WcaI